MKNYYLYCLLFVLLTLHCGQSIAQPGPRQISLQEVIALAQEQSAEALKVETSRENSYWKWRSFRSDYRPQLTLEGTLPDFSRTITPVTQPDGTIDFKPVSINNTDLGLTLSQVISPTGGKVFITSLMQRFDDFDRDQTRYNGNPAIIGVEQPLFAYNALKWNKKIEPLRYEEMQKQYVEDREEIAVKATGLYFELLLAQVNQSIAAKNLANNDTLYQVALEKYKLGRISKNDLLQLRLAVLNADLALAQANLDEQTAALALRNYIGLKDSSHFSLHVPENIPDEAVAPGLALAEAKKNRKESINFRRRTLEAESLVAKARGDNGFNANLFATFGLTNRAGTFTDIYSNPDNQQRARIGFNMPIMDWGRQRSSIKVAQLNQQLVEYTIGQEETGFEQEVITQVNQYNTLKARIRTTAEADAIAAERYEITKNTFLIGRISITDLNIALAEKDQARRAYITALSEFWEAHYTLRQLTLYDFERQEPIVAETQERI
ncbi:TolC family protein [Pontibacter anaerobius]|uniref:TolC family protein n=1 Tax=Pontibacter anaerobius TaxID=2993940 RepID=A0ABT3RIH2_9BACT|nr:TolC family protein [Pontibacter anaerobius]MCX2741174.1 TolC family protein [Pontibacter anaerobius]